MRVACFVILALLTAAAAHAAKLDATSPFGIVCPWGGLKDAGIDWVRGGAGATGLGNWCEIEKEKGVYTWDGSDSELKGDLEQGLIPLPILGYTPAWASSGPKKDASAPPGDLLDYARFVGAIASRYKGRVGYWEVWNEEDIGFFTGTIGDYTELLRTAYTAAKTADPACKVVFGGTAGVNNRFIERVYEFGAGKSYDVMAVHPYQWGDSFADDWFVSQLTELRALMNSHGDSHKEIWLTEMGWSTGDAGITEEIQARLLTQSMVTALTLREMGVTRTFWFCVKDWGGPNYGLLRTDGSKKPAFAAYSTLTKVMRGAKYAGRLALGKDVRCHVFTRGKSVIAVIWAPKDTSVKLPSPKSSQIEALDYLGERIQLVDESGFRRVQAKPQPIFITGVDPAILKKVTEPALPAYSPKKIPAQPIPTAWAGVIAPQSTTRPYVVAGGESTVLVRVQNQGKSAIAGKLYLDLAGAPKSKPVAYSLGAEKSAVLKFNVNVPASAKSGFAKCSLRGDHIAPASATVRVDSGRVIEFPANSVTESGYLFANEGSGGAPSVRFNGTWTYKFDLSTSKRARVDLNVGAHNAHEWRVLASSDNKQWKTILSGKSNRAWRKAQLDEFAGKTLYLKFEGNDQQLEELILHY